MALFALIHGGGDVGWYWHLVQNELAQRGHGSIAPDLPCDDDSADLHAYTHVVVDAIGDSAEEIVVVGHSFGALAAPLVAAAVDAGLLVLTAPMIPIPGEAPKNWFANTHYFQAAEEQSRADGGLTGSDDPYVAFYNGVERGLADEALRRSRSQSHRSGEDPWPLPTWPDIPTKVVIGKDDHFFPTSFLQRITHERLGVAADEVPGGHCFALSHSKELSDLLIGYLAEIGVTG